MPQTRQPELYAAAIIPYTAAAIALVLRIVARRKTRMPIVWEDYLAIVAFASTLRRSCKTALITMQIIGSAFTFLSLCSESFLPIHLLY
jgi:hypothetical protein